MDNKPNFSRGMKLQWAGSRERNLAAPVEAELFFLTSLFIELIDPISAATVKKARSQNPTIARKFGPELSIHLREFQFHDCPLGKQSHLSLNLAG